MNRQKITVTFVESRDVPQGVIGIFLDMRYSNNPALRMSYELQGQHAACDVTHLVPFDDGEWRAATPDELAPVLQELQLLGYDVLLVDPTDTDTVQHYLLIAK